MKAEQTVMLCSHEATILVDAEGTKSIFIQEGNYAGWRESEG